jgi:hypothetical protein
VKFAWRWTHGGAYLPSLGKCSIDKVQNFFRPIFWGVSNQDELLKCIHSATELVAPGIHAADNLLTWGRNNSMLEDEEFVKAWRENAESSSDLAIIWRRYILACAAYHCVQLDGEFVECGAYTGVGVKTVVDYLGGEKFPKEFWIYDLFEHEEWMLHHPMPEHGTGLHQRVVDKFHAYPQVKVVKGSIPDVFEGQSPGAIAYLHIDLNEAPAEIAALDSLFRKGRAGRRRDPR